MRKFLCALLALLCLITGATAEGGTFRAGTGAARLGDSLFFAIDEGQTDALVRVAADKPMLATRAEGLDSLLTRGNQLYYLEKTDAAWALMRRGETTVPEVVYAFDAGVEVRALSEYGSDLFLLVDDQLHILYPDQKLCLRLASAKMKAYVVVGEYAYFISATDIVRYEVNSAAIDAGCLYRLNLSTGNTSLLIKAGVSDLQCHADTLYFHNLSDAYIRADGGLSGYLYAFDCATETLKRALSDYDWSYCPIDEGLLAYREGAVVLVGADGTEIDVCETGAQAEVFFADGEIFVYDPDAASFAAYPQTR